MAVSNEMKAKLLEGKTEEQQLGLKAHWALCDLAHLYELQKSSRYYQVNTLIRTCEKIWK